MSNEKEMPRAEKKLDSVAIIMDGNGRWAKKRGLPRSAGHIQGAKVISNVLKVFRELGVHHVTLYAFSTENWKRPEDEVNTLMDLAYKYVDEVAIKKIKSDDSFSIKFLGDKSRLPKRLRDKCIEAEGMAKERPFICNIALNYGGRDEIVHAANLAIADGNTNLTEDILSKYMYTSSSPDPDLLIRTGGDQRISNFLLWQCAYAELMFIDTLWPDFGREEIERCVAEYNSRHRRFGGLDPEDMTVSESRNSINIMKGEANTQG